MKITIIGISDRVPEFTRKEHAIIQSVKRFAGGNRHHELVGDFLPEGYRWQTIEVPLSKLYQAIDESKKDWVVFASGDPLFYGIGITLKRELPSAQIEILPDFNSLQLLAHRFQLPYGEFQTISLTGRSWEQFDKSLIQGVCNMGILTDKKNTPASIAKRMLDYGYSNYQMYYGERLGGENERFLKLTIEEALVLDFKHPNCFYLEKTDNAIPKKGIPENEFKPLDGRPKMITKMPVRLATLAYMELHSKKVFWDVGACTGSVSIEAKLNHPHLKISAFEKRKESESLIIQNAQKFQTPGIELFIGDYLELDKEGMPKPDAVFLGGYGGKMEEILDDLSYRMEQNAVLAFNSVSSESCTRFCSWCSANNFTIIVQQVIAVDEFNPITILIAKRKTT